jgi:hypothetical protein
MGLFPSYCNAVAAVSLKLASRTTRSLTGLPDVSCSHPAPISGSYSSGRSSYSSDHSRIKRSPHLAVGARELLSFAHTLVRLVEYTLIHTSSLVTWWRFKVRPSKIVNSKNLQRQNNKGDERSGGE